MSRHGIGVAPLQRVMAKFLTTNGINYVVEEIIKSAKERVVLISPFLQLNDRIKELLSSGYRPDVDIQIIYGKQELHEQAQQWLRTVPHIRTRFCQNLHAKCYLNESLCVIGSLNLHLYSQQNNNEMGVMIRRSNDHQLYADVTSEVERLVRISEPTHVDRENLVLQSDPSHAKRDRASRYRKLTSAKLAARVGLQTRVLVDRLIGRGFIQVENGQPKLTDVGRRAGGESKTSQTHGEFIVWPADLHV